MLYIFIKIRVKLWSYRKCEKMTFGGNTAESRYLEQSKEIQLNWTRVENFDIYFCIHFNCLPKYNFCIGNWAPGYVSTKSWNFSNVFYFAKIVSLKLSVAREATRMPSLLYRISSLVLLAVNQTCKKTLQSFKIL